MTKEQCKDFIEAIETVNYYDRPQIIIDIVDRLICEYCNDKYTDEETYLLAFHYEIDNLIEVMNPVLPSFEILNKLSSVIEARLKTLTK